MERLHILDGYGYIFRAHFGLATAGRDRQGVRLTTASGMPTGALYVYASMLIRLHLDVHPERIAVVFDAPGPTFRDQLDADYKSTRAETPDDLKRQLPYFRPLTEAFSWPVLSVAGVEADDVIATLATRARAAAWDVTIFSGDKDLMQLVDDHVGMVDSMRQITYDAARVVEKFGVEPAQVGDFLALLGDTSDNVPGVAGVGKVTASKLLREYGTIDGILAHVGELKGKLKDTLSDPAQLERLALSRKLVELKRDVPLPVELDALRPAPWDGERLAAMLRELEFHALIDRLEGRSGKNGKGGKNGKNGKAGKADGDPAGAAAEAGGEPAAAEPDRAALDATVEVITDGAALVRLCDAMRAAGAIALHAEGDGQRSDRARLIGLGVALAGRPPAYLPLAHRYLSAPSQLDGDALAPLAAALADPAVRVVCHDAKELDKILGRRGLRLGQVELDTMLAAYLIDAPARAGDLAAVVRALLDVELATRTSVTGTGKAALPFESVEVEAAARIAGHAAAAVLAVAPTLAQRLAELGLDGLNRDLELPLARLLARIEAVGITLDLGHVRELSERVAGELAALERRIFELAGGELNVGSPKQLGVLLFDKLGLSSDRMKKTKTGYSTDAEVLESLREQHDIIAPILEHRELTKLKGTYLDALPPLVNPATGRLHTSFAQAVAATGRLSSVDPNLQNIPIRSELGKEIRRAFIAAPGKVLVSADYSQIELRILAHLSGDPVLCQAFVDRVDVHTQTAAEVFGIPRDEVGAHERRVAKAVNYGLVYGQSEFGLARALDIPRGEARTYIERYFDRFATVRRFMDDIVAQARQTGVATTILGRRRPIPGLTAKNFQVRSAAERVAQNTPMQGSGADIMKLAMLRVDAVIAERKLDAAILLTVHDELVIEVARAAADDVAAAVKQTMESVYQLRVPLEVDVGIGDNWADAH